MSALGSLKAGSAGGECGRLGGMAGELRCRAQAQTA